MTKSEITEAQIDEAIAAELSTASPEHISDVLKRLSAQNRDMESTALYGIRDSAVGAFIDFRFFRNDVVAFRELSALVKSNERMMRDPLYFEVWSLGYVNLGSGEMLPEKPSVLFTAEELIEDGTT